MSKENEQAFPSEENVYTGSGEYQRYFSSGLTKLEYFAGLAPKKPLWKFSVNIYPRPNRIPSKEEIQWDDTPMYENQEELDAYDNEYMKRMYAQWPIVYAKALIKQLEEEDEANIK